MNILTKLKRLSPVPIIFMDIMSISDFCGIFWKGKKFDGDGKPYIEIFNELENYQKIATLAHEIGHANCYEKNCKCMRNLDHTEREIHAMKFQLRWLLKHEQKDSLKWETDHIIKQANGSVSRLYYLKAAKHIMKLKLWQECLNYIKGA